jgi:cytochrome b subunit of formate dehydrogenase
MFHYENRAEKLISKFQFLRRMGHSLLVASLLIGISLGIGILGYRDLGELSWTDSFLNAAMILGGMGPVDPMASEAAKIFAGVYALYSGLAFLVLTGLLFGPIAHRVLHSFHYTEDQEDENA